MITNSKAGVWISIMKYWTELANRIFILSLDRSQ